MSSPEQIQKSQVMTKREITSQNDNSDSSLSRREFGKKILQTTQKVFSKMNGNELIVGGGEIIAGSFFFLGLSERTKREKDKKFFQNAGTGGLATGFTVFEAGMAIRSVKKRTAHTPSNEPIPTLLQMETTRLPWRKHSQ
ncbi:MAG: hypothetical protein KatS3mg089_0976 [Patescibacteria group bacterium]|nr:MAG: hypothetical protein KatS3mg089_0976 [Patescibacteria group bacterium]